MHAPGPAVAAPLKCWAKCATCDVHGSSAIHENSTQMSAPAP